MSTFAYSVAIRLTVANLASQGVRLLAKDLLAAHGNAVALGDKLKALKLMAVGFGMEKAGQGILGFMSKSIDASKEYTRQLSLMNAAGMSQRDIAQATAAAWRTSRTVITSTAAENLKAIRELRTVFGKDRMHEAYGILPTVQRTKGILDALTGKENEAVAFDMVKGIELRTPGVMSAGRMQQNADLMAQTLMAMGGTLNVHDYHMALKQAKTSAFGLNDDFTYRYFPTLMQEVKTGAGGAQSAGTALMSAYQAIIAGVLKKSSVPVWEAMGLISPSSVVHNAGGGMQLKPGAVRGAQLFQANPYLWANQVLAPAIQSYGAAHGLNREQVITGMFGNRNVQWLMNTLIGKAPQFERDRQLIQSGGNSLGTYQKLLKSNPQLAEQAMHAQWQNILSIMGYSILPKLIPFMLRFANGLDRIGQFMASHPNLTAGLAIGLLGVGTSLIVVGKALMTVGLIRFLGMGPMMTSVLQGVGTALLFVGRALLMNPLGLALTGIAVAAFLLWKNWDTVKPKLMAVWSGIVTGVTWMINKVIGLLNYIPGVHIAPIGGSQPARPNVIAPARNFHPGTGDILMDGKKVGRIVWPHVAGEMGWSAARPNTGTSGFNSGMGPLRPITSR